MAETIYIIGVAEAPRTCKEASDWDCKAPANAEDARTRGTCFACGNPVCTARNCSRSVRWYGYGRRRVCMSCLEDHDRLPKDVPWR
jgi:hypothetical protein